MNTIRAAFDAAKMVERYEPHPVAPYWMRLGRTVVQILWMTARSWLLCRGGHDFVETDGDPERQSFTVECRKCGETISGHW